MLLLQSLLLLQSPSLLRTLLRLVLTPAPRPPNHHTNPQVGCRLSFEVLFLIPPTQAVLCSWLHAVPPINPPICDRKPGYLHGWWGGFFYKSALFFSCSSNWEESVGTRWQSPRDVSCACAEKSANLVSQSWLASYGCSTIWDSRKSFMF